MNDPSGAFAATIERFSGFADVYDRYRPTPPVGTRCDSEPVRTSRAPATGRRSRQRHRTLDPLLGRQGRAGDRDRPHRRHAAPGRGADQGSQCNLSRGLLSRYRHSPDHCTDIVTCASLHWMEPQGNLCWRPPASCVMAGSLLRWTMIGRLQLGIGRLTPPMRLASDKSLPAHRAGEGQPRSAWHKHEHLTRMESSGCFRYTREILLHHEELGNAERLVGLAADPGSVMTLLKAGWREEQLGIDALRLVVDRVLGPAPQPWLWSARCD